MNRMRPEPLGGAGAQGGGKCSPEEDFTKAKKKYREPDYDFFSENIWPSNVRISTFLLVQHPLESPAFIQV